MVCFIRKCTPVFATAFLVLCHVVLCHSSFFFRSYCSSAIGKFRINVQQSLPTEQIFKASISISESYRHKLKPLSLRDLQLSFRLARARHCFLKCQFCCSSVVDVTLIKESRGDKSIAVVTQAKLQADMYLTLVLHFGYLHGVILASVPVFCRAGYFSFVYFLSY